MPAPYAFDPTGIAPANLVSGETHVLTAMNFQDYHFVVPSYAPFFEEGLVISHRALDNTVRTLDLGVDYILTHWFIGGSRGCAKPIYGSITFLDLELAGTVTLGYQTLGGDWNIDEPQQAEILADRLHNPRVTAWEVVSGYPTVFPAVDHAWDLQDLVGMSDMLPKLTAIADAIIGRTETSLASHLAATNPHGITPAMIGTMTTAEINALFATVNAVSESGMNTAISAAVAAHLAAVDPHPQYSSDTEVQALVASVTGLAAVRKPKVLSPDNGSTQGAASVLIQGDPYYSLYSLPQAGSEFQISTVNNFATVLYDAIRGSVQSHTVPAGTLTAGVVYYTRIRYQDNDSVWSAWSDVSSFTAGSASIATPSITAPANNATGVAVTATFTSSAFAMTTGVDTHASSDWEVWTGPAGTGSRVFESSMDQANLTSITAPEGALAPTTEFYVRVRYRGDTAGVSAWSSDIHFTTAAAAVVSASIGDPFAGGYLAGFFYDAGTRYALVVAPRGQGEVDLAAYPFSTRQMDISGAHSLIDGKTNTQLMAGVAGGYFKAAIRARALTINGFNDWYIASRDEAEVVYRNLKATVARNDTGGRSGGLQGENTNSDPAGAAYTDFVPAQTAVTAFRDSGTEWISSGERQMVTSTFDGSYGRIWTQLWSYRAGSNGSQKQQGNNNPTDSTKWVCRVVRRVPAPL
jgi:hypothetical protein